MANIITCTTILKIKDSIIGHCFLAVKRLGNLNNQHGFCISFDKDETTMLRGRTNLIYKFVLLKFFLRNLNMRIPPVCKPLIWTA